MPSVGACHEKANAEIRFPFQRLPQAQPDLDLWPPGRRHPLPDRARRRWFVPGRFRMPAGQKGRPLALYALRPGRGAVPARTVPRRNMLQAGGALPAGHELACPAGGGGPAGGGADLRVAARYSGRGRRPRLHQSGTPDLPTRGAEGLQGLSHRFRQGADGLGPRRLRRKDRYRRQQALPCLPRSRRRQLPAAWPFTVPGRGIDPRRHPPVHGLMGGDTRLGGHVVQSREGTGQPIAVHVVSPGTPWSDLRPDGDGGRQLPVLPCVSVPQPRRRPP